MITVICQIELRIFETNSLKEKRSILKSIIEKTRQKNNISIIESDYQNLWQRSKIGIAFSSMAVGDAHKKIESILSMIEANPYVEVIDVVKEEVHS